jgi:hypothetical protein
MTPSTVACVVAIKLAISILHSGHASHPPAPAGSTISDTAPCDPRRAVASIVPRGRRNRGATI